jgi:hypothetical protein
MTENGMGWFLIGSTGQVSQGRISAPHVSQNFILSQSLVLSWRIRAFDLYDQIVKACGDFIARSEQPSCRAFAGHL